jgi:tetratricopeptide (TPR) repeat protein
MKLPELPDYRYDELIGEGACGLAVRCTYLERETRVVKFLKAQSINPGLVGSCFRALAGKERHPGLADVYGHNLSEYPYYYISPYYGQRDAKTGEWATHSLDDHLGTLPPERALRLIDQVAEAVAFAHRQDVIHAGLKPANIFITGHDPDQWQVKVADWGQGYLSGLQYLEMGNLGFFASPEQLDNGDPSHGAGKRWDVYAFGVTAYLLLTGRFPRLEAQYQAYLRELEGFSHRPAAAFGTVLDHPEKYVDWIVDEEKILWPASPATELEEKRRKIIERCLAVDPRERFPDMRDVVAAFADCDHHLAVLAVEKNAAEGRHRVLKRAARWQQAAAATALISLAGAVTATYFFMEWRSAEKDIAETKAGAQKQVSQIEETLTKKGEQIAKTQQQLSQEKNLTQAELEKAKAESEGMREQMREQMRQAGQLMRDSQENGDRFFQLVLESRDSDVPGFAQARQAALSEAAKYYESLLGLYGQEREFADSASKAANFLGEIHFELGDYPRAETEFLKAKRGLEQVRTGDPGNMDTIRTLASVNFRLAEIARIRKQPDAGLLAIEDAVKLWTSVSNAAPNDLNPPFRVADAFILRADLHRANRDYDGARQALLEANRIFLSLQAHLPADHRVVGGLARVSSAAADLMRLKGDPGALDAYRQAAQWFGDAIKMNAAVSDYHLGLATTLAEVALGEDNLDKLVASANVLAEIATKPENSRRTHIFTALSECFGALAQRQRDGNQAASAMEWETKAIAIIEPLVANGGPGVSDDLRYALAERRYGLADLLVDKSDFAGAKKSLDLANGLLEQLLSVDGTNPEYRRLYAQAQGQLGYVNAQTGERTVAKQHYETARTQWEAYRTANPEDTLAAKALEWTKSQLSALN